MSRVYSDTTPIPGRPGKVRTNVRKGLKLIHIWNTVWRIGKYNYTNSDIWGTSVLHQVIYGPGNKEYHLWGDDLIHSLNTNRTQNNNQADEAKVKIYILTSILDKRTNWQFDLKIQPPIGTKLKIIYNNGTLKNVIFSGIWEDITVKDKKYGLKRTLSVTAYKLDKENGTPSKIW